MAGMAWTARLIEATCCTSASVCILDQSALMEVRGKPGVSYKESPQAPRAGSYKPPGVGFKRLSNVVGFSILLTDIFRISSGVKKSKSTLSMTDDTGWEMFMAAMKDATGSCATKSKLTYILGTDVL